MRLGLRSLSLLLFATAACAQVIGLGSYEKADEEEADGDAGSSNRAGSGGRGDGGTAGTATFGGDGGQPDAGSGGNSAGEGGRGGQGGQGAEGGATPSPGGEGGMGAAAGAGGLAGSGGAGAVAGEAGAGGTAGAGCTTRQLLLDGGFDQNSGEWFEYRDDEGLGIIQASASTPPAQTPTRIARLGGALPVVDTAPEEGDYFYSEVSQSVLIPEGTVDLTASCWYQVRSAAAAGSDYAAFILEEEETLKELYRFRHISNAEASTSWTSFSDGMNPTTAGIAGVYVWFTAFGVEDHANVSTFYIDSCSLVATVCP
jgi:hypothetical protein